MTLSFQVSSLWAILMFGFRPDSDFEKLTAENAVASKPEVSRPPSSFEEWMTRAGLEDWPLPVASEGELDISSGFVGLGSKEDIKSELAKHARILSSTEL